MAGKQVMMETGILVRGLVIGFSIAAPVGPIGLLCIRRTLTEGRLAGISTGMGAATADALYGCLAAFGLTLVTALLMDYRNGLQLLGGLFLCYLGVRTILARPTEQSAELSRAGLWGNFLSTFLLTLTNPLTILSFLAIFAGVGVTQTAGNYGAASLLVLGVFLGSALWWLLLSGGVSFFRRRLPPNMLVAINRLSGGLITGFGLLALASWMR